MKTARLAGQRDGQVDRPQLGNRSYLELGEEMIGDDRKQDQGFSLEILTASEGGGGGKVEMPEGFGGGTWGRFGRDAGGNDGNALGSGGVWQSGGGGIGGRGLESGNWDSNRRVNGGIDGGGVVESGGDGDRASIGGIGSFSMEEAGGNCGGDVGLIEGPDGHYGGNDGGGGREEAVKGGGDSGCAAGVGGFVGCSREVTGVDGGHVQGIEGIGGGIGMIESRSGGNTGGDDVGEKKRKRGGPRGRPRGSKNRMKGDSNGCNAGGNTGGDEIVVLGKPKLGRPKGSKTRRKVMDGKTVEPPIDNRSESEVIGGLSKIEGMGNFSGGSGRGGGEGMGGLPGGNGSEDEIMVKRQKLGRPKDSKTRGMIPDGRELHGWDRASIGGIGSFSMEEAGGNCGGDVGLIEGPDGHYGGNDGGGGREEVVKGGGDSGCAAGVGGFVGCSREVTGVDGGHVQGIEGIGGGIGMIESRSGRNTGGDDVGEKKRKRGRPRGFVGCSREVTGVDGGHVQGIEGIGGGIGMIESRSGGNTGGDDVGEKKRKRGRPRGFVGCSREVTGVDGGHVQGIEGIGGGIGMIESRSGGNIGGDDVGEKKRKRGWPRGRPRGWPRGRPRGRPRGSKNRMKGDSNGCNAGGNTGGDEIVVLGKPKLGRPKVSKTRRKVMDGRTVEPPIDNRSESEVIGGLSEIEGMGNFSGGSGRGGGEGMGGLPGGNGSEDEIMVKRRKLDRPKGSKTRGMIPDGRELHGWAGESVKNDGRALDLEGNRWQSGACHGGNNGDGWKVKRGRGRPKGWKKKGRKKKVSYGGELRALENMKKRRKRKIVDADELWGLKGLKKKGRKGGEFDGKELQGLSCEAEMIDFLATLQSFAPYSGAVLAEYIRKQYDLIKCVPSKKKVRGQPEMAKMVGFLATLREVVPYRGGVLAECFLYREWRSSIAALEYLAPCRGGVLAEFFMYRERSSSIPYDNVYKCEFDEAPLVTEEILDRSVQCIGVNEGPSLHEGTEFVSEGPSSTEGIQKQYGGNGGKEFLGGFGEFARQKDGGYGFSRLKNKCRRLKDSNNGEEIGGWSGEVGRENGPLKEIQGWSSEAAACQNDGDKMVGLRSKRGRPNSSENWMKDLIRSDGRSEIISSDRKHGCPQVSENRRTILAAEQDGIIPFEVTGWNNVGDEPVQVIGRNEKPVEIIQGKAKRGRPKGLKNRSPCIPKEEQSQATATKFLGGNNSGDGNILCKRKRGRPKGSKNNKVICNVVVLNTIPTQKQEQQMPVSKVEEDGDKESRFQVACVGDSGSMQMSNGELLADTGNVRKRPRGRPKKLKDQQGESSGVKEGKFNENGLVNSVLSVSSSQSIFTT